MGLVLMGDKLFLFLELWCVFLMYVKNGCMWVVLYDLVGLCEEWLVLISKFIVFVYVYSGCVVFY